MAGTVKKERILAERVRTLELSLIEKYLTDESEDNKHFRKELILKLATNILPRKNEHTGEDGNPIVVQISKEIADKNGITSTTGANSQ